MSLLSNLTEGKQSMEEIRELAAHQQLVKQLRPHPFSLYLGHCLPYFKTFFWYQDGKARTIINIEELGKLTEGQKLTFYPASTLPPATEEQHIDFLSEMQDKKFRGVLTEYDILKAWYFSGQLKKAHLPILVKKGLNPTQAHKIEIWILSRFNEI